jgi:MFS family permease
MGGRSGMTGEERARNLRAIAGTGLLGGFAHMMMFAVWQPFVLSLGVPMSTLGLLESLGRRQGLAATLAQPLAGQLADRVGRRPLVLLGHAFTVLAAGLYALAALSGEWRWLLLGVVFLGLAMISSPARVSLIQESAEVGQDGAAHAMTMAWWVAPGVIAPALGGYLANRAGFLPVMVLRVLLEASCLLWLVARLRETRQQVSAWGDGLQWRRGLREWITPPTALRGFVAAVALDAFAWGLGAVLLFGMLSQTYGFTTVQLGVMLSLQCVLWAVVQVPMGKWVDRYGCKRMMLLSDVIGLLVVVGWLLSRSFVAFTLWYVAYGLVYATWGPAYRAFATRRVPKSRRAEVMGQLEASRGLVRFVAPYLGGLLFERFGIRAALWANAVGVVAALWAIAVGVNEAEPGVGVAPAADGDGA